MGTSWWIREDINHNEAGILTLNGQSVERIARSSGGPCFIYSAPRISQNLERLKSALCGLGPKSRVLYAMKANRFLPLLTYLKMSGVDGIDVCSPNELRLARQAGFAENEISYTGTSVSNADLDIIAAHPDVWVNCDSLSSLKRLGQRCRGREIGLRINQKAGVGYHDSGKLNYTGATTKFGIYEEQFDEAFKIAAHFGMEITGLHFHAGCGYLNSQLENFRNVLHRALPFIEKVPNLKHVNIGGGVGVPHMEIDKPLDLSAWRLILEEAFGDPPPFSIWMEPGDYLVKDAGMLVLEANTVETKNGRNFIGVNGGFNLHIEPAFYQLPLEIVPCRIRSGESVEVTVAGNINEALDIFADRCQLSPVEEGDYLAFLNAGGYGTAMSSNHCMRGTFSEYLVF